MDPPGISLFDDDLKVYQESHEILRDVNEVILQASHDTGACYGVFKWAEIVFERVIDPDKNEIYSFLWIEQADGNKTKKVFERVKGKVNKRVKILTNTELNDVNLLRAINTKVVPASVYSMNFCNFTDRELKELDKVIKRDC